MVGMIVLHSFIHIKYLEFSEIEESFAALGADVRPSVLMHTAVDLETSLCLVHLLADWALKGPCGRVNTHMAL